MPRVRTIKAQAGSTFACTRCDRRYLNALPVSITDVWHKCPSDAPVQRTLRRMHPLNA